MNCVLPIKFVKASFHQRNDLEFFCSCSITILATSLTFAKKKLCKQHVVSFTAQKKDSRMKEEKFVVVVG